MPIPAHFWSPQLLETSWGFPGRVQSSQNMVQGLHMYLEGLKPATYLPASQTTALPHLCVELFPTSLPALSSRIPVGEGGELLTEFRLAQGVLDSEPPLPPERG